MIFVECKPDEALALSLGGRTVRHHLGKDKLLNKLMKEKNTKGIVDEDPGASQHPYLHKMHSEDLEDGIILKRDPANGNAVILLRSALEEWLLKAVEESGEKLTEVPKDKDILHTKLTVYPELIKKIVTKILPTSCRLKKLQKFIREPLG